MSNSSPRYRSEMDICRMINQSAARLSVLTDRALAPYRVTAAQWKVIASLSKKGACRITDLVAYMGHDQAAVSRLVARLIHGGYIERQTHPSDRRAGLVQLTPLGVEVTEQCRQVIATVADESLRQLTPAQRVEMHRMMETVATSIFDAWQQSERPKKSPKCELSENRPAALPSDV